MVFAGPVTSTSEISYTQFIEKVKNGEIKSAIISKDLVIAVPKADDNVENKSKTADSPVADDTKSASNNFASQFVIPTGQEIASIQYKVRVPENDPQLYPLLEQYDVEVNSEKTAGWLGFGDFGLYFNSYFLYRFNYLNFKRDTAGWLCRNEFR